MKLLLIIAVYAGIIVSGAAQAGEIIIDQRWSAVNHQTAIDTNDDGFFANTASFQFRGSPGRATAQSVGEFTPLAPGPDCPVGALQSDLVQQSVVQMYSDLSMIFFVGTSGHICVNFVPLFEITGQVAGIITGGTGRFEGAIGSWATEFEIFLVGETQSAFFGTTTGTFQVPD